MDSINSTGRRKSKFLKLTELDLELNPSAHKALDYHNLVRTQRTKRTWEQCIRFRFDLQR